MKKYPVIDGHYHIELLRGKDGKLFTDNMDEYMNDIRSKRKN